MNTPLSMPRRRREPERRLTFTTHAATRMAEFGLSRDDVEAIFYHPTTTWASRNDTRVYTNGTWCVIVGTDLAVITVVPRRYDDWEHEEWA